MSHSLLHAVTGKAVTSSGSCDLFVFVLPARNNSLATDTFIGKIAQKAALTAQNSIVRSHTSPIVAPSVLNMPSEISGLFATTTFSVAEGTILKVSAKRRAGLRSLMTSATLFLRIRANAAAQSIKLRPTGIPNVTFNYLEVMGAFDIISCDEAEAFGARISPVNRALAMQHNSDSLLSIETLSPESEPPVVSQTIEGSDTPMMVVQRRRVIEEV